MRYASLFTGAGGLDLAVEMLWPDAELVWWSEVDEPAAASFARHTDAPNLGDISAIDWDQVEPVDMIVGGFPCQDLSHAGKRAGLAGDRSGLWFRMADAIDAIRPSLVLLENVQGIYTAGATDEDMDVDRPVLDGGAADAAGALGTVLGTLADLGFDAEWGMLAAAEVGAAHQRRRWFCAAHPVGLRGQVPARGQHPTVAVPVGAGTPRRARGSVTTPCPMCREPLDVDVHSDCDLDELAAWNEGFGLNLSGQPLTRPPADHLLPTPTVVDMGANKTPEEWDDWTGQMQARHGNGNGHGRTLSIEARLLPTPTADQPGGTAEQHLARKQKMPDGANRTSITDLRMRIEYDGVTADRWGDYAAAIARWETVMGRPAPSPTDDEGRLSPEFVEWMMGWPQNWTAGTRSQRLKQCGNGVVPLQAAVAYAQLLDRIADSDREAAA